MKTILLFILLAAANLSASAQGIDMGNELESSVNGYNSTPNVQFFLPELWSLLVNTGGVTNLGSDIISHNIQLGGFMNFTQGQAPDTQVNGIWMDGSGNVVINSMNDSVCVMQGGVTQTATTSTGMIVWQPMRLNAGLFLTGGGITNNSLGYFGNNVSLSGFVQFTGGAAPGNILGAYSDAAGDLVFNSPANSLLLMQNQQTGLAITPTGLIASSSVQLNNGFNSAGGGCTNNYLGFFGGGAGLTNLDANNIATGIVPTARLAIGLANGVAYLRGDSRWATAVSSVSFGSDAAGVISSWSPTTISTSGVVSPTFNPAIQALSTNNAANLTNGNGATLFGAVPQSIPGGLTTSSLTLSNGIVAATDSVGSTNIQFGVSAGTTATWSTNTYINTPLYGLIYVTNAMSSANGTSAFTNFFPAGSGFSQPPVVMLNSFGSNSVTHGVGPVVTLVTPSYFVVGYQSTGLANTGYGLTWSIMAQTNLAIARLQ